MRRCWFDLDMCMCLSEVLTRTSDYCFFSCNDSWGTKGDNTTHTDLGDAKKDGQVVEVEVPVSSADM